MGLSVNFGISIISNTLGVWLEFCLRVLVLLYSLAASLLRTGREAPYSLSASFLRAGREAWIQAKVVTGVPWLRRDERE